VLNPVTFFLFISDFQSTNHLIHLELLVYRNWFNFQGFVSGKKSVEIYVKIAISQP